MIVKTDSQPIIPASYAGILVNNAGGLASASKNSITAPSIRGRATARAGGWLTRQSRRIPSAQFLTGENAREHQHA
jgi:hypothetical protein